MLAQRARLGVPMFAWVCEVVAWRGGEKRYDKLAKEFTKLLTSAYSTTALFGGILLFLLIAFYPKLMNYLTDIFFPSFIIYCILFLVETATLYLYWYGWDAMQYGGKKTFHIFLGLLLNFNVPVMKEGVKRVACGSLFQDEKSSGLGLLSFATLLVASAAAWISSRA